MRASKAFMIVIGCVAFVLTGCGSTPDFVAKTEPWRAAAEHACLASGSVRPGPFIVERSGLGGPRHCGAIRPFKVSAALHGAVSLKPSATLRCPMIPAVDRWFYEVVQPAAQYYFGQPVIGVKVAASYSCRPINHVRGSKLSEHGRANAIDISAFTLADGRKLSVKHGWRGEARPSGFLRSVHKGGCRIFSTVLGPNYNRRHHDHFHLDLGRHGRNGTYRVCK